MGGGGGGWKSERREKGGEKMEDGFIFFLWREKKGEMIILYPSPPFLIFLKWEET